MKRIVVGLLAAFLTMAGLVAVSPAPATAACPYTNCVRTAVNSEGAKNIARGKRVNIKVGVRAVGNLPPRGNITLTYYRQGRPSAVARQSKPAVPAGTPANKSGATFRTPKLVPGQYRIVVKFVPRAGSVFQASQGKTRMLTVRNR